MNILLIEPDQILATTYLKAFQSEGHTILIAPSAQLAIQQLDQQLADVIVLEVQMANHNGVEFLYELRSYSEWQAIPIIINSFIPQKQLPAAQLQALGVVEYLYKPTSTWQRLMSAVGRYQTVPA